MSRTTPQNQIDEQVERPQRLWKARKNAVVAAGNLNSTLREYDVNYKQINAISELVSTILQYHWMWTIGDRKQSLGDEVTAQILEKVKD